MWDKLFKEGFGEQILAPEIVQEDEFFDFIFERKDKDIILGKLLMRRFTNA